MFPEGTRSASGRLRSFKPGAFQIAERNRVPVQPIVVRGTAEALPKRGFLLQGRHPISIEVLDPIPAEVIARENGKPRVDAMTEVYMALSHLSHAARRAEKALKSHRVSPGLLANYRATISYHPLGVVGVIGPWNYPIFTPMGSIAYALAAGNTVVFKPSELTPLTGVKIAETPSDMGTTLKSLLK